MKDLIEKLAQAEGPSRKLDAEISRALAGGPADHWYQDHRGVYVTDNCAPCYTASIDAALTLVPEGVEVSIERYTDKGIRAQRDLASAWVFGAPRAYASTPAIALCIAALSAKEPSQ